MQERLNGKIAIITGATLGIGRATAERFVAEGAKLVLVARHAETGEELVSILGKDRAHFVAGDVADPATAARAVAVATTLGHLDVLVNNAGVDFTSDLLETSLEDVRRVIEVNFIGAFLMLKEAALAMRRSGKGGSIINVTSRLASVGVPTMTIYGASKGALLSLTRGAAIDLARDSIRVNAVAPGLTQTPLFEAWLASQPQPEQFKEATVATIPQRRFATPEDVASAILYFALDESAHVTGASLAVDGGYTAA
ncbi:MAG: SDR family oxidoreductase [Ktedonobacteraceae bacterium]|nr:SDR family oxidoreductase [Ktedonobacteraceae bacterium]MBO0795967.1 SDR family oxidoreductase [Ktedonobacteraceae bacterium]